MRFTMPSLAAVSLIALLAGCSSGQDATTTPSVESDTGTVSETPAPETCTDGLKNQTESDIDCGGSSCAKCVDGKACSAALDCASGTCTAGKCAQPACDDGSKNQDETDLDCGGSKCSKCADKRACNSGADCVSGVCQSNVCVAATCTDSTKNDGETDVDCGGPSCLACADAKSCSTAKDCLSGVCKDSKCAAPSCTDTVKNGTESDVDCGGSCSTKCADTKSCTVAGDCVSGVCTMGKCEAPTCSDGVLNASETDVDCGGTCSTKCADTKSCTVAGDCASGVCTSGKCVAPACNDSVKNGSETDTDCGGSCSTKCADTKGCTLASDCVSGVCTSGACTAPACNDGVKNGSETDTDCGGSCSIKCADTKSCTLASDCVSGVCTSGACAAPSCTDLVKNGSESDVDCGSACSTKCALTKKCVTSADCSSGYCNSGTCDYSVIQISTYGATTCALRAPGNVKCWGANGQGGLGYGDTAAGHFPSLTSPAVDLGTGRTAKQIAVGWAHVCAVLDNGKVKCWGGNGYGQLGLGDTVFRGDGTGEMGDALPYVDLGTGRTAKSVYAGEQHTCAILNDDSLKCWGNNVRGELGIGDTAIHGDAAGEMGDALPTVDLGTGRHAVYVGMANQATCALLDDASVKCWGGNHYGIIGSIGDRGRASGQMGDSNPAIKLGTGRTAKSIAVSYAHVCAALDNGTVKCWGYNLDGRLGVGDLTSRTTDSQMGDALPAIALGTGRTAKDVKVVSGGAVCALLDDSSVKCWGNGAVLGLGDTLPRGTSPSEMGDALPAVSLGTGRTTARLFGGWAAVCALLDDESVKCWGNNNYGQLGLGDYNRRGDAPNEMGDYLPTVKF